MLHSHVIFFILDSKRRKFIFISQENGREQSREQNIRIEVMSYLRQMPSDDENDLSQLSDYPTIKKLFLKYNCILPSSAAVERIFNFAKMILRPQRQRLIPSRFEKLLVLKNRGFKFITKEN